MKRLLFSAPRPFWSKTAKVEKSRFWSDKRTPRRHPGPEPWGPRQCILAEACGALKKRRVATTVSTPRKHLLKEEAGTISEKT